MKKGMLLITLLLAFTNAFGESRNFELSERDAAENGVSSMNSFASEKTEV